MTPAWLAEIEERLVRATPGPWALEDRIFPSGSWNNGVLVADENADGVCTVHNHGTRSWTRFVAVPARDHSCEIDSEAHRNMTLIAHAPTDLRCLIDALKIAVEALNFCACDCTYCRQALIRIEEIGK